MSVTLVADVGGANSNALIDVIAAQAIIDATPNSAGWGTDEDLQAQALVHATSLLDVIPYKGVKVTPQQALSWPRYGVRDPDYGDTTGDEMRSLIGSGYSIYLDATTIPRRMLRGCTMLALEILRTPASDIWGVDITSNIASKRVDVLSTTYLEPKDRRYGLRRYPQVWREIYPLTAASVQAEVERA